jgi:hypothetical protein
MSTLPRSDEITGFHDRNLGGQPARPAEKSLLWDAIEANHRCNCELWAEEDLARRRNVPDSAIAANKRAIDAANQKRNDAIERIDEQLLVFFKDVPRARDARQSSETPGAMIDRLSILSLKVHHMGLQTRRTDVDAAHVDACRQKMKTLEEQRSDLARCLDALLAEAQRGETYFKVYRQHKMYNNPNLNPAIYGEKR